MKKIITITYIFILNLFLFLFIFLYFTKPQNITKEIIRVEESLDPKELCLKKGGIPIYSIWNGALKDCKIIR